MLQKLTQLDHHWSSTLRIAERPGLLRTLAAILAHSGDSWFWTAGLAVLFVLGEASWKRWAVEMGLSILVLAVLVLAIKFTVRRRRPEGTWGEVYRKTDPHSFPSGHAARAVMLVVLATAIGPAWLAVILAGWAPLVVLARVAMGVHYLSDVVAGAILGALAGWLFTVGIGLVGTW